MMCVGAMGTGLVTRPPAERLSIVLAAIDCVVSGGHAALTATQVADEAGVDERIVRSHFPTAPALAEEILDYVSDQIMQSIRDDLPADDRLRFHFAALCAAMQDRPSLFVVLSELERRGGRDRLIGAAVKRSEQVWRDTLAGLLRAGRRNALWAREFDDEAIIDLIITTATATGVRLRGAEAARTLAQIEAFLLATG